MTIRAEFQSVPSHKAYLPVFTLNKAMNISGVHGLRKIQDSMQNPFKLLKWRTIPMVRRAPALTVTDVQKGKGMPSMSALNSAPARAITLSMWKRSDGPASTTSTEEKALGPYNAPCMQWEACTSTSIWLT